MIARALIAVFSVVTTASMAIAQPAAWKPAKNVEIIVGVGPGGGIDRTARVLQKILQDQRLIDVTATVVNKPGGGGAIAQAYLNQRAGDAHYFEITATSLLTNHITGKSTHGHKDFTPVAMLSDEYIGFLVRADSPLRSGRDLLNLLKADPESLPIGIATAAGNTNHIAAGLAARAAGGDVKKLKVVVFGSGGESMTALLGGHVEGIILALGTMTGHLRSGTLRGVVISSKYPDFPDIPTLSEIGYSEPLFGIWVGFFAPAGVPAEVTRALVPALERAIKSPAIASKLKPLGILLDYSSPEDMRAEMRDEHRRVREIATKSGLVK